MKQIATALIFLLSLGVHGQNVGIGTNNPHPSAQLDVTSTSRGLLPPRMTYAQIQAIQNPAAGLIVWCTNCGTNGQLLAYNGVGWSAATFGTVTQPVSPLLHTCGVDSVHNSTLTYGTMTDQDGNSYKTIQIGTQTWMAENLKVRRYRNGDVIPVVTSPTTWASLTTGATCWYNNDSSAYNCPYGKLYNYFAVSDSRNVCPTGWHIPSNTEWKILEKIIVPNADTIACSSYNDAGAKLKSTSFLWQIIQANNSSGWSGLPGGKRDGGDFTFVGAAGGWWTSTKNSSLNLALNRSLNTNDIILDRGCSGINENIGLSVRCIKD